MSKDLEVKFNADNIMRLAEQAGIPSGNALAQKSRIAAPNFYDNMNGQTFPSLKTLLRLLQGLGRSLEEIQATRLDELLLISLPDEQAEEVGKSPILE